MKNVCGALGILLLCGSCASTPGVSTPLTRAEVEACRDRVPEAMAFASRPLASRRIFEQMGSQRSAAELETFMIRYWEVLGINVSSVILMVDPALSDRISLRIAEADPASLARYIEGRLRTGRSVLEREDVASVEPEGEFLRVTLRGGRIASGWFYVRCGDTGGRDIGARTFVDYTTEDGDTRKLSLEALARLIELSS